MRLPSLVMACFLVGVAPSNAWTAPHVLVISDASEPDSLNPHIGGSPPTANLSEMTMAWLVRWDAHNQPVPELATAIPSKANGGVSRDGLTITYHLRHGVKWSDGQPFDAADVVFSANAVNNPANHETTRFTQLASVEERDPYTVSFHLKKPYSAFVEGFFSSCCANPSLLPKHLLSRYANINTVAYNDLPVGIGPFKFARWDRGKDVILVANPLYWRGRPKLDKIVYRIVPTRDALLSELAAHRVDLWYQFSGAYLPQVRAIPGVAIVRQPSYAYDHLDFNARRPALAERAVREALRFGIDRQALVENVANGVGHVQDSATPIAAPYYVDLGTTAYNPDKANALLDEAGWTRGSDGVRSKHGTRLALEVAAGPASSQTVKLFDTIGKQWEKIGVAIHVTYYPSAKLFATPAEGGVIYGSDWDITNFAWGADPYGDYSGYYGCASFPPAGANDLRWCNAVADGAMDALNGHYEQAQRTADVRTLMEQLIGDVPTIVLQVREDLFAYNSALKNYRPNNVTPFDSMMDVDI